MCWDQKPRQDRLWRMDNWRSRGLRNLVFCWIQGTNLLTDKNLKLLIKSVVVFHLLYCSEIYLWMLNTKDQEEYSEDTKYSKQIRTISEQVCKLWENDGQIKVAQYGQWILLPVEAGRLELHPTHNSVCTTRQALLHPRHHVCMELVWNWQRNCKDS